MGLVKLIALHFRVGCWGLSVFGGPEGVNQEAVSEMRAALELE